MKKITEFLIPAAIIIAGLLIAQGLYSIDKGKVPGALSPEKAGEKTIDFINQVALKGQATASLVEVIEESGLYKIRLKIEENEYESYVTKDGKILFPQGGTKISEESSDQTASKEFPKTDIPEVQLFVMSFCPYGNQAEELMMPVANLLGDKINIQLRYIVSESPDGKYTSLHGEQEAHQDLRELCVQKYQKDKFWEFIKEINSNCDYQNVDSCWENIAKKINLDIAKIKDCQKKEGINLLAQEVDFSKIEYPVQNPSFHENQERITISGSPTLVINGMVYDGNRTSEAYKEAICSAFNSPAEECSQVLGSETGSASGGCE